MSIIFIEPNTTIFHIKKMFDYLSICNLQATTQMIIIRKRVLEMSILKKVKKGESGNGDDHNIH